MNSIRTAACLLSFFLAATFAKPARALNAAYEEAPISYSKAQPADRAIFEGKEGGTDYKHLSTDDRDDIREILAATW